VDVSVLERAAEFLRTLPDSELAAMAVAIYAKIVEARQVNKASKPLPVQLSRLYERRRTITKKAKWQTEYSKQLEDNVVVYTNLLQANRDIIERYEEELKSINEEIAG
ncbi:MAG: hypothetical protein ACKPKO_05935, partial [Candidatus Fonsibacter sp.]